MVEFHYSQTIFLRFTVTLFHSNLDEKITGNEQKVTSNEQRAKSSASSLTYQRRLTVLQILAYCKNRAYRFYRYVNQRNQSIKVNNTESFSQVQITGVTKESILAPMLLNIFINDIFIFIGNVL